MRRRTRIVLLLALGVALVQGQRAAAASDALERQVKEVAAQLRCPICQNLSVADTPSELGRNMRDLIRDQLQQGRTREEIMAYFVEKYGTWILLEPERRGFNLIVWWGPVLGGLAGLAGTMLVVRRWVRAAPPSALPLTPRRRTCRPPDVAALLAAADTALERGDVPGALQQYRAVLEQAPENAVALTRLGLLAQQAGQAATGLRLIDRALQEQPRYLPAWQAKGMLHAAQGNDHEAIAAWETYLRLLPDGDPHRQAIVTLMAQARQRVQAAQMADAAPAEAAPATLSGTIRLAAAPAPALPAGAVLFIIARTDTGPPLAVKRVVNPQFPVHYTLGPEDVMVSGRAWAGQVHVSARVSASGTVGPIQPEDLVGHYTGNPVAVGATDVDVVLTSRGTP